MKANFYQTDIGQIPLGWEPYSIGDLVSFSGGSQPDKNVFKHRYELNYIRLIQIRDYKTDKYKTYIPINLARKLCDESDVMIGRYGPPIFQILRGIKGAYNVALIKVIPSEKIDREYLFHFIKSDNLFKLMELLSRRSSGQTGVELPALRAYPLPLPPMAEQKAIAQALSDIDQLIASLEKLIEKKQAIKTATMQQLLTGKTRLPGFGEGKGMKQTELGKIPEDWKIILLHSIIRDLIAGVSVTSTDKKVIDVNNDYLVLKTSCIYKSLFNPTEAKEIAPKDIPNAILNPKKDTLIISRMNTPDLVGECGYVFSDYENIFLPDRLWLTSFKDKKLLHPKWLAFLLSYQPTSRRIKEMATGTSNSMKNISKASFLNLKIIFPNQKEQKAITQVLSDMDTEISTLETKLKKTKAIKQGMMQELLTGKTRLI